MAEVTPQQRTRTITRAAIVYATSLIVFGFIVDGPVRVGQGLWSIITQPDILITDYFGIGGLGAPFVNSGILTLIFVLILMKLKELSKLYKKQILRVLLRQQTGDQETI